MPTTSNFGWTTPADTDLVKDGALAIRTLGNGIDTSFVDLKGGTTGQILSKASNTDLDFTWIANDQGDITAVTAGTGLTGGGTSGSVTLTNDMATTIDAKGDLIAGTAGDSYARLAVGTNGQVLTADSSTATGLKWATAASGSTFSGTRLWANSAQSISNATWTDITFNQENYDTDGFHSTSSNTSRITIPTGKGGYYRVYGVIRFSGGSTTGRRLARLSKNGGTDTFGVVEVAPINDVSYFISSTYNLAAGDYVTLQTYQTSGGSINLSNDNDASYFGVDFLGA